MGKRRKMHNNGDETAVKAENQKKINLEWNTTSIKKKGIKKLKREISGNVESRRNPVKTNEKSKATFDTTSQNGIFSTNSNNIQETNNDVRKKTKKKGGEVKDKPNDIKLQQELSNHNVEKILKKRKNKIITKNETNPTVPKEVHNYDESRQGTLNLDDKTDKKVKKNIIIKEDVQNSDVNKEKPKMKKKRKIVEEEMFDDEEIDKFCDELDDFHNNKYKDWVKLIEENLNKNFKKYLRC